MADGAGFKPLVGEVLPPADAPAVMLQGSPFTSPKPVYVGYGTTISEMVVAAGIPVEVRGDLEVFIGDQEVLPALWHVVRPKPGAKVFIRVNVRGGEGSKDVMRAIAMIGIMVVATLIAGPAGTAIAGAIGLTGTAATVGAALIGGAIASGITTAGMFLVNALIPPPTAKNQWGFDQDLGNPYGQITGLRNQAAPYGPIPRVFGRRRMFPMLAGRPYTETVGNDQYLRLLLLVGLGPLAISDIKLGENPIENVPGIQIEVREGWENDADVTLYEKAIREDNYSIVLDSNGDSTIQVTKPNTKEISVELTFPSGVNRIDKGELRFHEARFSVQYRALGSGGAWINADWIDKNSAYGTQTAGQIFVRDNKQTGIRKAGRWSVAPGQYEVQITRISTNPIMGETSFCLFTCLRSIVDQDFLPMPGLSLIALRMKASGQLNGVPDQINCIAESYLPTTANGSTWTWQKTRNPAWAYCDLIRRRGLEYIHADSRIDLPTIMDWAAANDATPPNGPGPYWTFDGVMEGGSIFTGLRTAASHGRASFTIRDGKYSVVRDAPQSVPVQHISPRNSWGYSGSKVFTDIPHAIRVRFPNEEKLYAEDEVVCYAPGYSEAGGGGTVAASRYETLDMPGCTRPKQAWREGMYHLGVLILRPETHVVSMDVENLRCTLGSYVRFSHDVIKIGLGHGRLKGVVIEGGNVVALDLDSPVEMAAGKTYGLRCRKADFASAVISLVTQPGVRETVTLATPIPLANAPSTGDLFQFGEAGLETAPMIVKRIAPGPNLTAVVSLVDAQEGVWTADQGIIPPFNTYITNPVPIQYQYPPSPSFRLASDSSTVRYLQDGTAIERVAISFDALPSSEFVIDAIEVQFRDSESPEFSRFGMVSPDTSGAFIEPVYVGRTYEVRCRTITRTGTASPWATKSVLCRGKNLPPAPPSALAATAGADALVGRVHLTWTLPEENDLWATEVWASETNDREEATLVGRIADPGSSYEHVLPGVVSRYYWIRAQDLSGNYSTSVDGLPVDYNGWWPEAADGGVLGQTRAVTTGDVDTTPPGTPSGLTLTSAIVIGPAGVPIVKIYAGWTANTEPDIGGYDTEIQEGAGVAVTRRVVANNDEWVGRTGALYSVRVRAVDRLGNASPWSLISQVYGAADTIPPAAPVGLATATSLSTVFLTITGPADTDLAGIEWYESTTNDSGAAYPIGRTNCAPSGLASISRSGLSTGAVRYYFAKAYDTSGNLSTFSSGASAVLPSVQVTEFASTIRPVELMTTGQRFAATPTLGRMVYDTTLSKLFRGTGSDWTAAADGADIISNSITAGKIAAGAISTTELAAGAITTEKLGALQVTAEKIAAGSITADKIQAGSITGDRISTSTTLPGSIIVGGTGVSLFTTAINADDPAARINASPVTLINPGRITVAGATTLANWRQGGDETRIAGGAISANTIAANKLTIGNRGITVIGCEFQFNAGILSWTTGYILWPGDDGNIVATLISAGSTAWAGGSYNYIYWPKGAGQFYVGVDNWAALIAGDNIICCSWSLNSSTFVANYGGTIVHGDKITTGTINANKLQAGTITADRIQAGAITADRLVVNGLNYDRLTWGATGKASIYYHVPPYSCAPGSWWAIMGVGVTPSAGSPVTGHFTFIVSASAPSSIAVRVVRVSDGTVVWGHGPSYAVDINVDGTSRVVSGQFFDSTNPAFGRQQYDVQVYCYGATAVCVHRTLSIRELARDAMEEIQLYAPAGSLVGPGTGPSGGGNINGDTGGYGGTGGTIGDTGWTGGGIGHHLDAY